MIRFIIRCAIAASVLLATVALFYKGSWGWAICTILLLVIIGFTFFRDERMILALNAMRSGDTEKAKVQITKITAPQFLPKKQHAYVLFLQAVLGTQELGLSKSEELLRRAISMGLRTNQDKAVARMHLSGICAQTGRKKEALTLLAEAKKLDDNGMMKDQINNMKKQMQVAPSKNQMRMAQMVKGRQKSPRR